MLACSGPGHGTPCGREGSYKWTCVSMMGTEYLWASARGAAAPRATVPAAAALMNLRRFTGFLLCAIRPIRGEFGLRAYYLVPNRRDIAKQSAAEVRRPGPLPG